MAQPHHGVALKAQTEQLRVNNILLTLAGALILALAALFVGPYFIDWNSYRAVFEEQATRLAGRPVSVEGNVNLRLLPAPYVSFERVKIAGNATGDAAPLLEIENYTLWLAVPPLLQGEIEARAMEIDRPTLRLALDADGTVNWSGLGASDIELPFVPRNVAFRDTNVIKGKIELRGADGNLLTQVSSISGTFTARALTGPFKFVGEQGEGDNVQSVRWSTGRLDQTGGLRIKSTLKNKAAGTTYAADGLLQKITTAPVFTGGIAGKLRRKGSPGFEMKADIYADTSGGQFREITLLLDAEGSPQIVNGDGSAEWQGKDGASARLNLTSRWLDIDRLQFSDGEEKNLLARIDAAQTFLANALPGSLATTATFKATQINFGGEAIDDVTLAMTRRGAVTTVEGLSANLPGAAQLNMTGELVRPEQTELSASGLSDTFKGKVTIRGRTLSRFANWMKPEWGTTVAPVDGAFALTSVIMNSADAIKMEDVRARLGATRITGSMRHGRDTGAPLKLALETPALDLSRYFPDVEALGTALRSVMQGQGTQGGETSPRPSATVMKLSIGELQTGKALFADVRVDAQRKNGTLSVQRLAFASARGLELDATTDRIADGTADGPAPLRFVLRARNKAAYDELMALSGFEVTDAGADAALTRATRVLLPAHLAGSVAYEADGSALNIRYDGMVAGNRALGRARIEGDSSDWSARDWTMSTDIALEKPASLLKEIGLPAQSVESGEGDKAGRVVMYAIGQPRSGLNTNFSVRIGDLEAGFSGAVESAADGVAFAGKIEGNLKNNAQVARLLLRDPAGTDPVSFVGKIRRSAGELQLTDLRLMSKDTVLTATASVVPGKEKTRATMAVEANRMSLPAMLSLAMPETNVSDEAVNEDLIWRETPFDFARMKGLEVTVSVKAERLAVARDITMVNAEFSAAGDADGIAVRNLKASAGGGTLTAEAEIKRRPAGAQVKVTAKGKDVRINALSGSVIRSEANGSGDSQQSNGVASFNVSLNGIGLSPKGVVSVMQGEGEVSMRQAELEYFSPQVVQDVAADIADENASVSSDDLKSRIAERLADRPLRLGTRNFSFRIRDGAVQADPIRIDTPAASITSTTFVDIARLRLDSEWRVTPKTSRSGTPLPPVTVFYTGDVRNASAIKPGFGVAALERELTVRRLEGNIDQLEELQSLRGNIRKPGANDNADSTSSARGTLRPTIGGEGTTQTDTLKAPPKPARRKRSRNESVLPSGIVQPPVELKLQTPEGANPT